jgi:hypothetical protein
MKSGMQTYFFLASYGFRSEVLVFFVVKKIRDPRSGIQDQGSEIRDPEKIHRGSGSRIQSVKNHRIPDQQHWF